jgi:hypothetical protein
MNRAVGLSAYANDCSCCRSVVDGKAVEVAWHCPRAEDEISLIKCYKRSIILAVDSLSNCCSLSSISAILARIPLESGKSGSLYSHGAFLLKHGEHLGRLPSHRVFFDRHSLQDSEIRLRFDGRDSSLDGGILCG